MRPEIQGQVNDSGSMLLKLGEGVGERPVTVISIIAVISIIMLIFSGAVESDTSMETFTPDSDDMKAYEKINDEYGNTEIVMVGIESKEGPILTTGNMVDTLSFTKSLFDDPVINDTILEPKDLSVISVPTLLAHYSIMLRSNGSIGNVTIDALINEISNRSDSELRVLLKSYLDDPAVPEMYKNYMTLLLPKDLDDTLNADEYLVLIMLDRSLSESKLGDAEQRINDKGGEIGRNLTGYTYGYQFMMDTMTDMSKQIGVLFVISFIIIFVILLANFRTAGEAVLSFISLSLAVIWAYGFLGIVGWKADFIVSIVPILIIGIGVDFSIHSLMSYREKYRTNRKNLKKAVVLSIGLIGTALGLATLTTAIGFGTNVSSSIPSVRHFGIMAGVGILSAFILNVTFVPAAKMVIDRRRLSRKMEPFFMRYENSSSGKGSVEPEKQKKGSTKSKRPGVSSLLFSSVRKPVLPLIIIVLFSLFSFYGTINLKSGYDMTGELPNDSDAKIAVDHLGDNFDLNTEFALVLIEGDVLEPLFYERTLRTVENMNDDEYVLNNQGRARVEWLGSYMKLYADSMVDMDFTTTYYSIDVNRDGNLDSGFDQDIFRTIVDRMFELDLTSHYFLHKNTDSGEYDGIVLRVYSDTENFKYGLNLQKELDDDVHPLKEMAINIQITGDPIILGHLIKDIEETALYSTLYCVIAALIILTIYFYVAKRSLSFGLLVSLPIFMVVLWIFGAMYIADLPLNMMTATTGALTIGLGVDYTIHIAHRWLWEYEQGRDIRSIHKNTMSRTGRDLFASAVTTATAFGILMFLNAESYFVFGFVLALAIITSFIAAVLVLPIFLGIWTRYRINRN